jgi:hypothetical protein
MRTHIGLGAAYMSGLYGLRKGGLYVSSYYYICGNIYHNTLYTCDRNSKRRPIYVSSYYSICGHIYYEVHCILYMRKCIL